MVVTFKLQDMGLNTWSEGFVNHFVVDSFKMVDWQRNVSFPEGGLGHGLQNFITI